MSAAPHLRKVHPSAPPSPESSPESTAERPHDFSELSRQATYDNALPPFARIFFQDVCELAAKRGYCWAEDGHFAAKFDVTERAVQKWINTLIEAGYLRRGRKRGKRALVPLVSALKAAQSPKANIRSGAEPKANIRSGGPEHPFDPDRNGCSDTESYITPEGGECGARAREGCPPDGLGARAEVLAAAVAEGIPASVAAAGFDHYAAQGWMTTSRHPQPIVDRLAKLRQWAEREPMFAPSPTPTATSAGTLPEAQRSAEVAAAREPSPAEAAAKARRRAELDAAIDALPDDERAELEARAAESIEPGLSAALSNEHHPSRYRVSATSLRPVMRDLIADRSRSESIHEPQPS